ncbi:uncharacterized protein TrAtP1_010261 [Trichoderma atroviride]|uniref:uncharacterized protein n=1 Tax=Hypocrea atroviridis TaxID=63577 RepID=UPI0033227B90|nr:hypothetical protein TrAtP1_010261 [Trichoderma atroviride]
MVQGSGKKDEAEARGNRESRSHQYDMESQEAWERKGKKAALTGRKELNMESGGVRDKKKKRKENKESILFNSIRLKRAFSHAKASCNGGQQISHHPNCEQLGTTRFPADCVPRHRPLSRQPACDNCYKHKARPQGSRGKETKIGRLLGLSSGRRSCQVEVLRCSRRGATGGVFV